jgi:hypothetical protein
MALGTLTAANAIIMLTVPNYYPNPQQLQGFAADDVYDSEEVEIAETSMGVDGILSAGLIYAELPWTLALQSNSPSIQILDNLIQAQFAQNDLFPGISVSVTLTGLGIKYQLTNGYLKKAPPLPSAKKILQPRKFYFVFNGSSPATS